MIISAHSLQEAVLESKKIYNCKKDQLKIYVVKPPKIKFWGMFNIPGKYRVELADGDLEVPAEQKQKDGYIEIVSGKATVTDPLQGGRYASIFVDSPQINVYINGNKISGIAIVTKNDSIEFEPITVKPSIEISAHLTKDKMKAILKIVKIPGKKYTIKDTERNNILLVRPHYSEIQPPDVTLEQCLDKLENLNVNTNLISIEKIKDLIETPGGGSAIVAEGVPPINGINSDIKFFLGTKIIETRIFLPEKRSTLYPIQLSQQ